ncbi:MAG: transposase [Candidatus Methylomirabilaceae bacterium]
MRGSDYRGGQPLPERAPVGSVPGLVPSEHSSGEKRRLGSITKAGNLRVRVLLVEAAWRILRSSKAESAPLREWALGIAERRGRRIRRRARAAPGRCAVRGLARWATVQRREIASAAIARHRSVTRCRTCEPRVDGRGEGTSALQLMAAVESRRLVGATLSLTKTQLRRGYRSPRSESANIRLSSSSIPTHDHINRERQVYCSYEAPVKSRSRQMRNGSPDPCAKTCTELVRRVPYVVVLPSVEMSVADLVLTTGSNHWNRQSIANPASK